LRQERNIEEKEKREIQRESERGNILIELFSEYRVQIENCFVNLNLQYVYRTLHSDLKRLQGMYLSQLKRFFSFSKCYKFDVVFIYWLVTVYLGTRKSVK
jgi:hypothetical protein